MAKVDPYLKTSEDYRVLYDKWRRMRKYGMCAEWDEFAVFAEWALDNGYSPFGCTIKKINPDEEYSPSNCRFLVDLQKKIVQDFVNKWNTSVNRIREHYGMEPFEVYADGDD